MTQLPADVYVLAVQPHPAWPDYADPDCGAERGDTPSVQGDLADVIARGFSFLDNLGFAIAPVDRWERSSIQVVPYLRDDAVVLVVASDRSLFFVVDLRAAAEGNAMEMLASLVAPDAEFVTFAAFRS